MWSLDVHIESPYKRINENIYSELSRLWFQLSHLRYAEWFNVYLALLEDIASWKLTINLGLFEKLEREFKSHQKWIKQNNIANRMIAFAIEYRKWCSENIRKIQQPVQSNVISTLERLEILVMTIRERWSHDLFSQLRSYALLLNINTNDSGTKK